MIFLKVKKFSREYYLNMWQLHWKTCIHNNSQFTACNRIGPAIFSTAKIYLYKISTFTSIVQIYTIKFNFLVL